MTAACINGPPTECAVHALDELLAANTYVQAQAKDPSLAGNVSIQFSIGPRGSVSVATLTDSTSAGSSQSPEEAARW